jgi:rhodanese-related sulfurtransferase
MSFAAEAAAAILANTNRDLEQPMPSRRVLLLLAATAIVGAGTGYRLVYPTYDGRSLDAPTAFRQAEAGEIILIDIRRPDEWQATGTGRGAHLIDLRRADFIETLSRLVEGDRTRPIALICAKGVRSARTGNLLTQNGFTQVINVPEGMLGSADGPGWIARGLPLATP